MNSFEKHGIDHLSASSCNLFAAQPALWVMERLLGRKAPVGAAAHRGTAAEHGVCVGLLDPSAEVEACTSAADFKFNELTRESLDPKLEDERKAVAGCVMQALPELRAYGRNVTCQERIEWRADDIPIPFVGFIDFRWPNHNILVDLKTQLRLAGEIKRPHARQVASYAGPFGANADARLLYVTPSKRAAYHLENVREHIDCLVRIGQTIERFLAVSNDPEELAGLLVPDVDSFYYSDPKTRQLAWETWRV